MNSEVGGQAGRGLTAKLDWRFRGQKQKHREEENGGLVNHYNPRIAFGGGAVWSKSSKPLPGVR